MSNHTVIAFVISLFVFFMGYTYISQKTDEGTIQHTCTYVKEDMCIIPLDNGEIKKADISKLDQSVYSSGETIVYDTEVPNKAKDYAMLLLASILLFLVLRFGHYILRAIIESPGSLFD